MKSSKFLLVSLSISLLTLSINEPATAYDTNELKQLSSLETRFLGRSFSDSKKETLDSRVSRVEKLVFGEAKTGDPGERIATLAKSVNAASEEEQKPAQQSTASPNSQESQSPKASNPKVDPYPRVGALEKAILGNVFPSEDISNRLARMEEKSFGKPDNSDALSDRTDALQKYIEKKTKKKLFVPPANSEVASAQGQAQTEQERRSKLPGIINAVSTAFFGPATNQTIGGINTGMMGFGGIRVRNRADVQREQMARQEMEQQTHQPKPENPLVRKATAPPASANMKVKVGWCEVKLYGRTFPTKHLLKRLEQINGELEYKPGAKGINLMDDVDSMIKLVSMKSANRTASNETKNTTH